jgi:MoxR-like ATPase
VENNETFLVLEGPTGIGKTHIPSIYAFLTRAEKRDGKLLVPDNQWANISFHREKNESDLQGNFVIKKDKVEFDAETTFKKVVEAGGVILLSELNTVVKNHETSLAWWLKQIE